MTTPFDFINDVSYNKKNIFSVETEQYYIPFLINRGMSNFIDTVLHANTMNMFSFLDKKMQNDYYLNTITKSKRFSKWHKNVKNEDIQAISEYYKTSLVKAAEIFSLINPDQIKIIKTKLEKGGCDDKRIGRGEVKQS